MEQIILTALRSAIQGRGLTIADISKAAKVNRTTLSLMLSGVKSPTLRTLCRVCGVIGVEIVIIVGGAKTKKMKKSTTFFCGEYGQFGFVGMNNDGWLCTSEKLCEDREGRPFMRLHWRK